MAETDAARTAANDQDKAEAVDFASVIADYFSALLTKGMERTEALTLARDYQAETFESKRPRVEED